MLMGASPPFFIAMKWTWKKLKKGPRVGKKAEIKTWDLSSTTRVYKSRFN